MYIALHREFFSHICHNEILCPCDPSEQQKQYLPVISIYTRGAIVHITHKEYLILNSNGMCTLAIAVIIGPYMILGVPFLRSFIPLFDKKN
jgi:hypothetical protein